MNSRPRAVVTGLGILAANGVGCDPFWQSLLANQSGIGPITLFDTSDLACHFGGEVRGFHIEDFIPPDLKPRRMGRFTQLAVAAAKMAVTDARLDAADLQGKPPVPIVLGISTSAMDIVADDPKIHSAASLVSNAATSTIGYLLHGQPSLLTVSSGCASSLEAIAAAARIIQRGETDIAIAGGGDAPLTHFGLESMLRCRMCSTRNDNPGQASRPFDRDRDFGVLGEGAAILVLENDAAARARGVRPYAEIVAAHVASDPYGSPEGSGIETCMRMALANGGCRPSDVQYINAHAPSDIHMDLLETTLIKRVFGPHAYRCLVTSIKGATGYPTGAGGAMQTVATCLALRHQVVPPTTNFVAGSEGCDLDYVPGTPRHSRIQRALVNSHGIGRCNCTVMLAGV